VPRRTHLWAATSRRSAQQQRRDVVVALSGCRFSWNYVDEPLLKARESVEAFLQCAHDFLGQPDPGLVRLGDELDCGVPPFPGHPARKLSNCFDCVQEASVPVVLQHAPASLDRIVFAVIRRVVGQAHADLVFVCKLNDALDELCPSTAVLWSVVLVEEQRVDTEESNLVGGPPPVETVYDAVACDLGVHQCDMQFVILGQEDPRRRQYRLGCVVVVERCYVSTVPTSPREFTYLHPGLGIYRDAQKALVSLGKFVDLFHLVEDGVCFRDLFFWAWSCALSRDRTPSH